LDTKCSADNFTEIITDYGLCYSFNLVKDPGARLNVSGTGSKYGLELVLNIEQYEYMAGPHDSAGVRMLIHDQHEIPRVKDLASSIPSSMNAFLGIQVTKVRQGRMVLDSSGSTLAAFTRQ
jgi:acid-sensing ion channel 2